MIHGPNEESEGTGRTLVKRKEEGRRERGWPDLSQEGRAADVRMKTVKWLPYFLPLCKN